MSDGGAKEAMTMERFTLDTVIREQLIERKEKLNEAMALGGDFEFANLLGEVDHALTKIDNGTFGQCEACDGHVEPERLLSDPLTRVCLGELSDAELRSLESDLELASTIQRELLPRMSFSGSGWKADFVYEPHGIVSG